MIFTDAVKLCALPMQHLRTNASLSGLGALLQRSKAGDREGSAPGICFSFVTGFTVREKQLQLTFCLVSVF